MSTHITPVGAVVRGLVAGAAGTAVMTAYQTLVMKLRDSEGSQVPAEVAKKISEGVLDKPVPDSAMPKLNNAMHVGYGTSWGVVHGLVAGSRRDGSAVKEGIAFGTLVWGASLVELPALKLAPPVWEQPPAEVALDWSYHLLYGVAVAVAFAAIAR